MGALNTIKDIIKNTKFENNTYIAGGYVRDIVMGLDSYDIDIVVNLPNGGIELANYLRSQLPGQTSQLVVYERFNTAMLVINDEQIEFVETRTETYTSGSRKPKTEFGDIREDVFRRDLTINSLLKNISTGEILDLTGKGLDDIKNKVIRSTNDPNFILKEDPLRILRAVRFAGRFSWMIDSLLLNSMIDRIDELDNISSERIQAELIKTFKAGNVSYAVRILNKIGFWSKFIPEWDECIGMKQNKYHTKTVDQHIIDVVINCPEESDWKVKLAAFLHDIGKSKTKTVGSDNEIHFLDHENVSADIACKFLTDLKFSNSDKDHIVGLVKNHMRIKPDTRIGKIRNLIRTEGYDFVSNLLDLIYADVKSHRNNNTEWLNEIKIKLTSSDLSNERSEQKIIDGNELMEMFNLKPGPEVGKLKKKIQNMVDEDPNITKEQILKNIKK